MRPTRNDPARATPVAWPFAVVAAVVTGWATQPGLVLGPDGVTYLAAGRHLADGVGVVGIDGRALTLFPPGLPAVVAVTDHLPGSATAWLRGLFVLSSALTVLLASRLLGRAVERTGVHLMALGFVACASPLLAMNRELLTEPLFVPALLAFLLLLARASDTGARHRWVLAAASWAWVLVALRYAALFCVPAGAVAVALADGSRRPLRQAIRDALIFGAVAVLGPLVWMLRNRRADGTYLGPRDSSIDTLRPTLVRVARTIGSWLLPAPGSLGALGAVVGGLVLLVVAAACVAVAKRVVACRRAGVGDPALAVLVPVVLLIVVVLAGAVVSQLTTALDVLGDRLLVPAFVPLVLLLAWWVDRRLTALQARDTRAGRTVVRAASVAAVALLVMHGLVVVSDARRLARAPVGFATPPWTTSELIAAVDTLPTDAVLYSNQTWPVWYLTGRDPVLQAPVRRPYRSNDERPIPPGFASEVACGERYLVWFGADDDGSWSPEALRSVVPLEVVATTDDGVLFRFRPERSSC